MLKTMVGQRLGRGKIKFSNDNMQILSPYYLEYIDRVKFYLEIKRHQLR